MLSRTQRWILFTACISVTFSIFAAFAFLVVKTISARADANLLQQSLSTTSADLEYGETVRALLRETASDRSTLESLSKKTAVEIVEKIRSSADDAEVDVSIDSIAPDSISLAGFKKVPVLNVSFSSEGSFRRLYNFLQLVENSELAMSVQRFSLDSSGSPDGSWTLRAQVIVYTEM